MNSIAVRLYVIVALVVGAYGISRWLKVATAPPEVEMPTWSLRELPYQLGKDGKDWRGEDVQMDPKITLATGAEMIVDRLYHNEAGQTVTLHTAMFKDAAVGVYHCPTNCYPANGWKMLSETRKDVLLSDETTLTVSLVGWQKEEEKILVAYWYQLGNHVLYDRLDLGGLRWEMRGQPKWPVLLKVMAQTTLSNQEDAQATLLSLVDDVAEWLNKPEHQKYLAQWHGR